MNFDSSTKEHGWRRWEGVPLILIMWRGNGAKTTKLVERKISTANIIGVSR